MLRLSLPRVASGAALVVGVLLVSIGVVGLRADAGEAVAATTIVNSTEDVASDDGMCTLREAITSAASNSESGHRSRSAEGQTTTRSSSIFWTPTRGTTR